MTEQQGKPEAGLAQSGDPATAKIYKGYSVVQAHWLNQKKKPDHDPEITIGIYQDDGTTEGEFGIRWLGVIGEKKRSPRLEVFSDGWNAFFQMPELHEILCSSKPDASPETIAKKLADAGYRDKTLYEPGK